MKKKVEAVTKPAGTEHILTARESEERREKESFDAHRKPHSPKHPESKDEDYKGVPHFNRALHHASNDNLNNPDFQDNRAEISQRTPDDTAGGIANTEAVDQ